MPNADLITPGLTQCSRCRARDAVAVLTEPGRERWPEPLCFDCIEVMLEHENAAGVSVHAAALQAVARDELELRIADPQVRAMRENLSTPAAVRLERRCWAMIPDGSRCRRDATITRGGRALVCDTHGHGCRVPAGGWTSSGQAQGPVATLDAARILELAD